MIRIAEVPQEFLPKMPVQYPPHQGYSPMIEERAYSFFATKEELVSDYIYIPIQWTSWHVNPGGEYGQNTQPLIDFCQKLTEKHPNEKFFTVVQYDGGTLVPIAVSLLLLETLVLLLVKILSTNLFLFFVILIVVFQEK